MERSPQYATILINFAGLFRLTGHPRDAVGMFLEAKELLTGCKEPDAYAYASVLNNISLAYQDIGDYNSAFEASYEAYELIRQDASNTHELATALNNLAVILFKKKDFAQAEALADQALALYASMKEENVHHAAALSTKATLLYSAGNHGEALRDFLRALELTGMFFGKNIEYAVCERNIATVCETIGDIPAALQHLESSASVFETILGVGNSRSAECRAQRDKLTPKELNT